MPSNAPPSSKTCHRAYKDIWVRVIYLSEGGRFQNPLGIAGVFFTFFLQLHFTTNLDITLMKKWHLIQNQMAS